MSFWFVFICWGWSPERMVILCFQKKEAYKKSMSYLMFPKKVLRSVGNVPFLLSLPIIIPPTLCCLVFHCEFLLFSSSFLSTVRILRLFHYTLVTWFKFLLGLSSCQGFSYSCYSKKMVSPHIHPAKQSHS